MSLSNTEGDTIEQSLTWNAESTITVGERMKATAEMHVREKQQQGDFVVVTTFTGKVSVKYVTLNDQQVVFSHTGKIGYVIGEYLKLMEKGPPKITFKGVDDTSKPEVAVFKTAGSCKFRFGIKQVVKVTQEKIDCKEESNLSETDDDSRPKDAMTA